MLTLAVVAAIAVAAAQRTDHGVGTPAATSIELRGHALKLVSMGSPLGQPVIVSSGDGGWMHLAPHAAAILAAHGYDVVGFDTRTYLEAFTSGALTLGTEDVQRDYATLVDQVRAQGRAKPILVGVSEGAGLSVLAASNAQVKSEVAGVVTLGLPNVNELAWRWKDAVIYVTHAAPREPSFTVDGIIAKVSPVPLADIHATHDEFAALADAERVMALANEPKMLWSIPASDHRFSDNLGELDQRLLDAIAWVNSHRAS